MNPPEMLRIFAYGSNMLTARLRERVPSAHAVGIGRLDRHALRWHKRSSDGSGKCDAMASKDPGVVWGVVFEIDRTEKSALDRAEGLGRGYKEIEVDVAMDHGLVTASMYCATDTDPSLRPYDWYKDLVVAGAREHGLPEAYVRGLEAVESAGDPDAQREARKRKLLPDP